MGAGILHHSSLAEHKAAVSNYASVEPSSQQQNSLHARKLSFRASCDSRADQIAKIYIEPGAHDRHQSQASKAALSSWLKMREQSSQ